MPKITVFMAAYNAGAFIRQAIESILNQSFTDFELLIVNDGSTDDTIRVINSISDSRIRVLENIKNEGLAFTRNRALNEAKGEFMAILDSDDIAFPERLKIQLEYFKNNPKLAILGGCAYVINQNGKRTGQTMVPICASKQLHATLLFYNSFVHSTIMMRLTAFKAVNGYPLYPIAEDYGLFAKIAIKHQVENIPEYLIEYRIHSNNISLKKNLELNAVHQKILALQFEKLLQEYNTSDINMILEPVYNSPYTLAQYSMLYNKIICSNRQIKQYPIEELEHIIFKNWFMIIMEKGKMKTFKLYFEKPFYNKKFVTAKHIRQICKRTIRSLFN